MMRTSKHQTKTNHTRKDRHLARRAASLALGAVLTAGAVLGGLGAGVFGGAREVYAKEIGQKNEQACDHCEKVRDGETPKDTAGNDYDKLLKGAVYRGGNARSGVTEGGAHYIDNDPNDFANSLPYGNVFVDTSKLSWSNPANFIIDIKDDRFKWVGIAGNVLEDALGTKQETEPLIPGKTLTGERQSDGNKDNGFIAYVGELKPYHNDIKAVPDDKADNTNIIEAPAGDYLYRITYLNAATLADGTRGNVVMTMTKVEFETSIRVDENNPRILTDKNGNTYQYTKAIVPIQGPNDLEVAGSLVDSEGNFVNEPNIVVKTKEEVDAAIAAAKAAGGNIPANYSDDKVIRHTIGGAYTFDIQVQDPEGNAAAGTMAYAAKDLDLPSYQTNWGRERGSDPFMFAEGLSILSGSQSYALVPEYNHKDATTLADGWVPNGIGGSLDSPLSISGGTNSRNADGVRFASTGEKVMRDKNGKWDDVLFGGPVTNQGELMNQPTGTIMDFTWDNINNSRVRYKNPDDIWNTYINSTTYKATNIRRELAGKIKRNGTVVPWNQITIQEIIDYFKGGSYSLDRDDNGTYDSGFAVLIDPAKTTFRWTGSTIQTGTVGTNLFDTTLFTYVEQTHGTGGGIYLENYSLTNGCKPTPQEGVVTMGRGSNATVTAVPEEGYRIRRFLIGGAELSDPVEYTLDNLDLVPGVAKSVDRDGITFEMNADGTVDVTIQDVQNPRHIHVDFDADYYFYKIWKGGETPTALELTAVPYAYIFTDVTLPVQTGIDGEGHAVYTDTHFSIDGTKYTADDGKKYILSPNNMLETEEKAGGEPLATLPYVLRGNSFVATNGKEYPVTVQFGVNFAMGDGATEDSVKQKFTVNGDETYVTVLTDGGEISPGNVVWKIKYPAAGVAALDWPALPIETEPDAHNGNHVERNYWFVTEKAPAGWSKEGYDNTRAEAPGVVPEAPGQSAGYYDNHVWAAAAKKDYDAAAKMIRLDNKTKNAYLSVFSKDANTDKGTYGGEISNVPAVVVKAEKTWDDLNNAFNTRKDIWLHVDAKIGEETKKDILPPQKLAAGTENTQTVTWGDLKTYETDQENVEIIADLADIPLKDGNGQRVTYTHEADGSYPASNGITYWLNELVKVAADGSVIEYSIRETLDAAGTQSVGPANAAVGLYGYTAPETTDTVAWDKMSKDGKTEIGEGEDKVEVPTYEGKLKNEMETVEIKATKVWNDENDKYGIRKDVTFDLLADGTKVDGQSKTIAKDAAGEDLTVKWTAPKYLGNTETVYTIAEQDVSPYGQEITGSAKDGFTVTNTFPPEEDFMEVTRTITYTYLTEDGVEASTTVTQTVKLRRVPTKVDTEGKTVEWGPWELPENPDTDAVTSPDIEGWTPNKNVPKWDIDLADPKNAEEHVVYQPAPPTAEPMITKDGQYDADGSLKSQTSGTPNFTLGTKTLPDGSDNSFTYELLVPEGATAGDDGKTVTVLGEGTYTIDPETGEITFTPEEGFTGKAKGIGIKGTDKLGQSAETTYTPIVVPNKETAVFERIVEYRYFNAEGNEVVEETVETITVERIGDYDSEKDKNPEDYLETDSTDTISYGGENNKWTTASFDEETSPEDPGWKPDAEKTAAISGITPDNAEENGFVQDESGKWVKRELVIYTPEPPTPNNGETWGAPRENQTYDAKSLFTVTTPTTAKDETGNREANEITEIQLIDPDTGNLTNGPVNAYAEDGTTIVGTYKYDPSTGKIVFSPRDDFDGAADPLPVKLVAKDKNGMQSEPAEYKPHFAPNVETKTITRTIDYKYDDGTPVLDENGEPLKKVQTVTFTRKGKVDPDTGDVTWEAWEPDVGEMSEVVSPTTADKPSIREGYAPAQEKVEALTGLTPDDDPDDYTIIYHKPPTAEDKKTFGPKGEQQKGTPPFTEGSKSFTGFTLLDEEGNPTDEIKIPGEGSYKVDPETGEVTFTPEPDFVGTGTGVNVQGTDENGETAVGRYTPAIVDTVQTETVKRTVDYVYDDGTPVTEEDPEHPGQQIPVVRVEEKTFTRTGKVDPDTGTVTWEPWVPQSYADEVSKDNVPADVTNNFRPDKETVDASETTPDKGDENYTVVYRKRTFTVTYLDGNHGTSDGKGNEGGKSYGDEHPGGNTVTPNKGFKFTGTYSYIIYKPDGTTEEGETTDPTSIPVTGDIVFTPKYEPLRATWIDPATGRTIQEWTNFDDDGNEPVPPANPTREGYTFVRWDREVDAEGNVTYKAVWEPVKTTPATPTNTSGTTPGTTQTAAAATGDTAQNLLWFVLIAAALAVVLFAAGRLRRR